MPYNLLFSRNRSNQDPVTFGDVEISQPSVMVDALSVLSQFRRSAGWLYPVRKSGTNTYERGRGHLILFGQSRVISPDFEPPYYFQFYPRVGVGTYILSFYSGYPELVPHPWVYDKFSGLEFKLNLPGLGTVVSRSPFEGGFRRLEVISTTESHLQNGVIYWREPGNQRAAKDLFPGSPKRSITVPVYDLSRAAPTSLIL
jgi:hypothetical protein